MKLLNLVKLCSTRLICNCKNRLFSSDSKNVLKLENRGMYADLFPDVSRDEMITLLNKAPQSVYAGFDPTADSLHIGNLLILMNLLHWQRFGHQPIALLGGATGMIGDPSHRETERAELEKILLEDNLKRIQKNIETIFDNHARYLWNDIQIKLKPLITVNNLDWYKDYNIIDFIRKFGKHFRMGIMLNRTSVELRLKSESGMSFTEFTYPIFQAYDWFHLVKKYNCRFQIGGSDQMGNIMSGHELISRTLKKKVYGITLPLITAEGGKKFGKSIGNALWLSPEKSSSFQMYQYFLRTKDTDVEKFLKLFTFLPLHMIKDLMEEHLKAPEKWLAQKTLAEQITLLVHGEKGLSTAKRASSALYDSSIESLASLNEDELKQVLDGARIVHLQFTPGLNIYELATQAQCFNTDHDAQRIISAGGFYVNNQRITNLNEVLTPGIHILPNNITLLRTGKRTYHIIKWI